jgi:AsmA family
MQPTIEPTVSSRPQTEIQLVSAEKPRRKRLRIAAWAAFVILLLIIVPPFININFFRRSIIRSISDGLGRPVHASSVELALFPRPAFMLHNLTVDEDPAFGAEPVMMAANVTATLRASTLWHRRVEIATLHFDTPSLNLTRNAQAHWNFESLLHNSPALHAHPAPRAAPRSHFPYIEATEARINFKIGVEKLPFSLENANLSLWKESGGIWHVRIRARPVRTDMTVADAGQIRGDAVLKSASVLNDSLLTAHFEWRQVELGEIGRLLQGRDDGWRGMVDWSAQAQGTLADLPIVSTIAIDAFHRAEFIPDSNMGLTIQCAVHFGPGNRMLETMHCTAPAGAGQLVLRGVPPQSVNRPSSLHIALQRASAEFFLDLLRHVHSGIAEDARASGNLTGTIACALRGFDTPENCTGQIQSRALTLHLPGTDHPLRISPIVLTNFVPAAPLRADARKVVQPTTFRTDSTSGWILSPAHVSLGGATPAMLTGNFNSAGVALRISGPADLSQLAALARAFRASAALGEAQSVHGTAQVALSLDSDWLPQSPPNTETLGQPVIQFTPSRWAGNLQIRNATLKVAFLPAAIDLSAGQLDFSPFGVEWTHLSGTFAHTAFDGNMHWNTPCAGWNADCKRSFRFHISNLNASRLETALRQDNGSIDLLRALNPWSNSPELPQSSGIITADTVSAGHLSLKNATLQFQLNGHTAQLLGISSKVFGGTLYGGSTESPPPAFPGVQQTADNSAGSIHWGDGPPSYKLRLSFQGIGPDRVAAIWQERWGLGLASGQIDLNTSGWTAAELAQHATGKFNIVWRNGTLARAARAASADDPRLAEFQRWDAEGIIHDKTLTLNRSRIVLRGSQPQRTAEMQSVAGTVTFGRILNLRLEPSGDFLTGPLPLPIATTKKPPAVDRTTGRRINERAVTAPDN